MNKKVRVNSKYVFNPVPFDELHPAYPGMLHRGDLVKVVNKFGCPKANTMGMCYVELNGKFAGMVCTNSLIPLKEYEKENKNETTSE